MPDLVYRHWHEGLNPDECVSVDGSAPGELNLSHWPGNRTPRDLKHDISTGICLNLAQAKDRYKYLRGLTTVTNNHWDTDGVCSAYAVTQPGLALVHGQTLLSAALVGDTGIMTTPEGLKVELTLTALTKRPDSPVCSDKFDDDLKRRQAQYDYALALMPKLLAKPDLHADWFAQEYWTIQQDLRALREGEAEIERYDSLDFAIVTSFRPLHEVAVNTATTADRVLFVEEGQGGKRKYTLRLSTLSWFDWVSAPKRQRPDWAPLIEALKAVTRSTDGQWKAEDLSEPTPCLYYAGADGKPAMCLAIAELVKRTVAKFYTDSPRLPAGV